MDIIITEKISGKAIEELKKTYDVLGDEDLWKDRDSLSRRISEAKAMIVRNQTKVDGKLLEATQSLLVIGRAGVGYDNIDVEAASKHGIVVCYAPNENSISTAEHAFALILALYRKIPAGHLSTANGHWDRFKFLGNELFGKTLGILGLGKVGARVAIRARAFGMKIIAYDKFLSRYGYLVTEAGADLKSLDEVFVNADVISCHLPLTDETRGMVNYSKLQLMKMGSIIINTGRGELIVERDLVRALREGIIAGAGLDVREKEPPPESELNRMENVVLTPHVAGLTVEAQEKVIVSVAGDVRRVLEGLAAVNYVNFPLPKKGEAKSGQ